MPCMLEHAIFSDLDGARMQKHFVGVTHDAAVCVVKEMQCGLAHVHLRLSCLGKRSRYRLCRARHHEDDHGKDEGKLHQSGGGQERETKHLLFICAVVGSTEFFSQ